MMDVRSVADYKIVMAQPGLVDVFPQGYLLCCQADPEV